MATKKTYNMILNEYGFMTDGDGVRVLKSKRFPGAICWAEFSDGKVNLHGTGQSSGFETGYISVSGMQLRQLLTILIGNHI
jgi:hypothetical protein